MFGIWHPFSPLCPLLEELDIKPELDELVDIIPELEEDEELKIIPLLELELLLELLEELLAKTI